MSLEIRKDEILPILLLSLAFSSTISAAHINPLFGYIVVFCMSGCGLARSIIHKKKNRINKIGSIIVQGNFYIKVIIHVYSIVLIMLGLTESRFFSYNIQTYINALSAIGVFYLYKERTLHIGTTALLFSFLTAIICQIGTGNIAVHDLSFGAEYILVYIFVVLGKLDRKNIKWVLLATAILMVSNKDIQVLGFILIMILYALTKRFDAKDKEKILNVVSLIGVFGIYLFVFLVVDGNFFEILARYGIKTSGRNYYYKVARDLAGFNLGFLGIGRNGMQVLMGSDYSYMHVGNIHSDILRMYCECGFVLFFLWIINYFVVFPHLIKNKCGVDAKIGYLFLTYFTFISYLTDNMELYLVSQFFYILTIIFTCLYKGTLWNYTGFNDYRMGRKVRK